MTKKIKRQAIYLLYGDRFTPSLFKDIKKLCVDREISIQDFMINAAIEEYIRIKDNNPVDKRLSISEAMNILPQPPIIRRTK